METEAMRWKAWLVQIRLEQQLRLEHRKDQNND